MEPIVDSVSVAQSRKEIPEQKKPEGEVDNPPVITVDQKEEDKNMGLTVERMGEMFIEETDEIFQSEKRQFINNLEQVPGLYNKFIDYVKSGIKEYGELQSEIEKQNLENKLLLADAICSKGKKFAHRCLNFLVESYKQYQKMQAENPNIANLYYTTSFDPYYNSSLY